MSVIVKGAGGKNIKGINFITDVIDLTQSNTSSSGTKSVMAIVPMTFSSNINAGNSCAFPDGTVCRVTSSSATVVNAKGDTLLNLTGLTIDNNNASIFRIKHPLKQIYYFCGSGGTLYAFNVETQSYTTTTGICFVYFDKWNRLIAIPRDSSTSNAFILNESTLAKQQTVKMYADKDFAGTLTSITKIVHGAGAGFSNDRPCFISENWTVCPIGQTTVNGTTYNNHYISYYIDNRVDVVANGVILHFYSTTTNGYFGYISKDNKYLITCDGANHALKVWDFTGLKMGSLVKTISYFSNATNFYHFSAPFICKDGREVTIGIGDNSYPIILSFKNGNFSTIGFTTSVGISPTDIGRFSLREKTGSLYFDSGDRVIQCGVELEDYK